MILGVRSPAIPNRPGRRRGRVGVHSRWSLTYWTSKLDELRWWPW